MSPPSTNQKTLAPIANHWHNRSLSSVASDSATFYSAYAHPSVELRPLSSNQDTQSSRVTFTPRSQSRDQQILPSPKTEALKMARQDSGYAAGQESSSSSTRTSTSSTRRLKSPSKRTPTRPSTHRATRSSPTTVQVTSTPPSSRRPSLLTRHTTSQHQQTHQPYQFYQFPTLQDQEEITTAPPPAPPPATCQYWTSDSTRRLEYAAIDAASQGVRGFFIKLVPDCILPPSSRRTRFHCDDEGSDAGSVRRYRLALPEEKDMCQRVCERASRPSGLRRWTSAWRKGSP
ncbi:hypothetical protein D0Z07_3668 [Hyphodiscus hymeniophilus]|uniref:Uncharacterized protein n=1 Tax=Hyphodiscus hymeniophilus TaxID=353542 RepID=A0A9P6VKD3_9HELO|nr:hypothetical protein D0Z07_3668 [Hyphodiscus hymeniophilus]